MSLDKPQKWTTTLLSCVGSILERKCPKINYFSLNTSCSFDPSLSSMWRSRCTAPHMFSPYTGVFLLIALPHRVLCCLSCFSCVNHEKLYLLQDSLFAFLFPSLSSEGMMGPDDLRPVLFKSCGKTCDTTPWHVFKYMGFPAAPL